MIVLIFLWPMKNNFNKAKNIFETLHTQQTMTKKELY